VSSSVDEEWHLSPLCSHLLLSLPSSRRASTECGVIQLSATQSPAKLPSRPFEAEPGYWAA
jgi:hypothetical protein